MFGGGLELEHELGVCLDLLNFMLRKLDSPKSFPAEATAAPPAEAGGLCCCEEADGCCCAAEEAEEGAAPLGGPEGGPGVVAEVGVAGEAEFLFGELESEDFLRLSTSVAYATRRSKPDEMASCHSRLPSSEKEERKEV